VFHRGQRIAAISMRFWYYGASSVQECFREVYMGNLSLKEKCRNYELPGVSSTEFTEKERNRDDDF